MDTTQLVRQHFLPEYPPLSRGHIAGVVELVAGKPKQKATVTAFTDLLLILLPGASSEALYGPCKWGAIHGTQFPAVGAEVQVGVDETNHPVVLWWAGEQQEPAAIKTLEEKVKALEERKNFKPAAPGETVVREVNKELEPSATKDTFVTGYVLFEAKAGEVHFKVGPKGATKEVSTISSSLAIFSSFAFIVPVGEVWEGKLAGEIKTLAASYQLLD